MVGLDSKQSKVFLCISEHLTVINQWMVLCSPMLVSQFPCPCSLPFLYRCCNSGVPWGRWQDTMCWWFCPRWGVGQELLGWSAISKAEAKCGRAGEWQVGHLHTHCSFQNLPRGLEPRTTTLRFHHECRPWISFNDLLFTISWWSKEMKCWRWIP